MIDTLDTGYNGIFSLTIFYINTDSDYVNETDVILSWITKPIYIIYVFQTPPGQGTYKWSTFVNV